MTKAAGAVARTKAYRYSYAEVVRQTKQFNLLYNVFTWPSMPLSFVLVNYTGISANAVTLTSGAAGLVGSVLFLVEQFKVAACAFGVFFVLDCTDGTIARLKGQASDRGGALDLFTDRVVLMVAVLSRIWWHNTNGQADEAVLCAVYLASHYLTDIHWLTRLRRTREKPPWIIQPSRREASQSGWRSNLGRLARVEWNLRPGVWVCNIAFLIGPCLFTTHAAAVYALSAFAMQWWPLMEFIRRRVKHLVVKGPEAARP